VTEGKFSGSVEFRLALISAFLYGWAYSFEAGYCHYFGISPKVIEISATDLVKAGLVGFSLVVVGWLTVDLVAERDLQSERKRSVAVKILAYATLLGPFLILQFGLVVLFYTPIIFALLLILIGWTHDLTDRFQSFVDRAFRKRPIERSEQEIVIPSTTRSVSDTAGFVFLALLILFYAYAVGHAVGKQKNKFLETPLVEGVLLVEKYGDYWVGKRVEQGNVWASETVLLKLQDGVTVLKEREHADVFSKWAFRWPLPKQNQASK
jgi:hypothetical protein